MFQLIYGSTFLQVGPEKQISSWKMGEDIAVLMPPILDLDIPLPTLVSILFLPFHVLFHLLSGSAGGNWHTHI